jgi:predicted nucleotidyltransferase
MRHNHAMDLQALVPLLQKELPKLMALYAFGSRAQDQGHSARLDSDLDLAVLVEAYADPIQLFDLSGRISDFTHCPVDLVDLRAASTVMQYQILTQGERIWAKDLAAGLYEAAMLTEKLHLDESRRSLIQDVMGRGAVYG